jgi:hypothetical protein
MECIGGWRTARCLGEDAHTACASSQDFSAFTTISLRWIITNHSHSTTPHPSPPIGDTAKTCEGYPGHRRSLPSPPTNIIDCRCIRVRYFRAADVPQGTTRQNTFTEAISPTSSITPFISILIFLDSGKQSALILPGYQQDRAAVKTE